MCGIVGYVGQEEALPFLLDGLFKLEYRGYDSAGVSLLEGQTLIVEKSVGRIADLQRSMADKTYRARVGIGHTRWATHGPPSNLNAHPHADCRGEFSVAHNGIIENHLALRTELMARGHVFASQTDSEVVAHLLEEVYDGDLSAAVRKVAAKLVGSYALAVVSAHEPDTVVGLRHHSPLVVGLGADGQYLASDIPALMGRTRRIVVLEDGELAVLRPDGVRFEDLDGRTLAKQETLVTWDTAAAEKGGYPHFMLKEIFEQPRAIQDTLRGRLGADEVLLPELDDLLQRAKSLRKAFFVACGTSYHALAVARIYFEQWCRLPVELDLASEFRYRQPLVQPGDLLVVVSQSGETADTLAALREGRKLGATTLAITNVVGSSIDREADRSLHTWAGPEISVASTKAYTTQIVALALAALGLAAARGTMLPAELAQLRQGLAALPELAERALDLRPEVQRLAQRLGRQRDIFFMGRGLDYASAMEGQLKLKEISYLHAEALAAGELKHGTLALIQQDVPVITPLTQHALRDKSLSNIAEVRARGAHAIALTQDPEGLQGAVDEVLILPRASDALMPVLVALPLQLLAYEAAVACGTDVDKPRNLAKSVTVE